MFFVFFLFFVSLFLCFVFSFAFVCFLLVFFVCFFFCAFVFRLFFLAFLRFSPTLLEDKGNQLQFYCKMGNLFHSDPVCTNPVQNFPTSRGRKS